MACSCLYGARGAQPERLPADFGGWLFPVCSATDGHALTRTAFLFHKEAVSGFRFFRWWTLELGSSKRRLPEKKLRFGGSRIRDVICSAQSSSQNRNPG